MKQKTTNIAILIILLMIVALSILILVLGTTIDLGTEELRYSTNKITTLIGR
jgi:hypothetical protein